jgi:diguanylate cyclase (GGDEF)-like protein
VWTLIVIGLGILMTPLDVTTLVPQLPPSAREFLRQTIWIILCAAFFGCFWYFDLINRCLTSNIGRERDVAQFAAAHDPLTGLLNRGAFAQRLEAGVQRAQFSAQPLALVYVDLDGFKGINDNLGHHAGDHLLNELAQRLRNAVRNSDSVARLGGDEFGLLLEGATRKTLERLLPSMLDAIAAPIVFENRELSISASLGAALLPIDASDPELLSRCADHAMYGAKLRGRNQFAFFSDMSH